MRMCINKHVQLNMVTGQCKRPRASDVWEVFEEPVLLDSDRKGKQVKMIPCKLCDQWLVNGGRTTN